MIEADLVTGLRAQEGFSSHDAVAVVEGVLAVLKKALQKGEPVQIATFGTLKVGAKAERVGRNPATGHWLMLPPRRGAHARPGATRSSRASSPPLRAPPGEAVGAGVTRVTEDDTIARILIIDDDADFRALLRRATTSPHVSLPCREDGIAFYMALWLFPYEMRR